MYTTLLWKMLPLAVLSCLLALSSPSQASTTCDNQLTFGTGPNRITICVSDHGNLVGFESPGSREHIRVETIGEGYVVCSDDLPPFFSAYDAGFDESGWGAPTKNQPRGPNTFPLTIIRTTADGSFKLKQTFDWDPTLKEVIISMTLTN